MSKGRKKPRLPQEEYAVFLKRQFCARDPLKKIIQGKGQVQNPIFPFVVTPMLVVSGTTTQNQKPFKTQRAIIARCFDTVKERAWKWFRYNFPSPLVGRVREGEKD